MTYEELQDKVSDILNKAETEMENLIEKFNNNLNENDECLLDVNDDQSDEYLKVDTVDLSGKFSELRDYVEDYS